MNNMRLWAIFLYFLTMSSIVPIQAQNVPGSSIVSRTFLSSGGSDKMHGLNTYDYEARQYNPVLGRWDRVDPLCEKYYAISPYVYCVNNPVRLVDPDGRENIVVVGSNNNSAAGSKLMFVNQGIAQIRRNHDNYGNESNTMVLFKAGYTDKQIEETREAIAQYGGTLKVVNSAQEFINYVNNGNNWQNDLISNMVIFSHGKPGSIEFGYDFDQLASSYMLNNDNVSDLSSSAFKGTKSTIMSFACRSGLGSNYCFLDLDCKNSIAQQMANSTGTIVGAFLARTDYSNTLRTVLQRRIGNASSQYKIVDNAILTPHGALNPVLGGSTPWYVSKYPQVFTPK